MTPLLFVGVAVAGGVGSVVRFVVDGLIRERFPRAPRSGIVLINVAGSLLLGLITGLVGIGFVDDTWRLIISTGLLGGFTTFSTASLDTVRLLRERGVGAAVLHGFGTLLASVAAAAVGLGLTVGIRLSSGG